ncbi:MAG TPA: hypothetical protein VM778_14165 [Gemmatimonadota bacterium]|nr:hypothetical protein [Gemmatimonadota bacterium]
MATRTWTQFLVVTATAMLVATLTPAAHATPTAADRSSPTSRAGAGYKDVGHDPDDRAIVGHDPDIRRTSRRVYPTDRGRALKIKVHAYEELGLWWFMEILLDSRGGPEYDYEMHIINADLNGAFCVVQARREGHRQEGRFQQKRTWTACRVRAGFVHPTKRIRWRIVSESGDEEPESVTERAPDRGWYE